MISDKYKAIFVHVPRTGGHSISAVLDYNIRVKKLSRHAYPKEYLEKFPEKTKEYFKFTFVRNPFDRLVSCWIRSSKLYTKDFNKIKLDHRNKKFFENYVRPEFQKFVKYNLRSLLYNAHFRPQYLWHENIDYDFIGRFEFLNDDLKYVIGKINIVSYKIRKLSSTQRVPWADYYNDETKEMVKNLYNEDFKIWGKVNNDRS